MDFKNRDIISINDFSKEELLFVLKAARQMEQKPKNNLLRGKILATLFFGFCSICFAALRTNKSSSFEKSLIEIISRFLKSILKNLKIIRDI